MAQYGYKLYSQFCRKRELHTTASRPQSSGLMEACVGSWVPTTDAAVASIEDGQCIAIGGFLSVRHPMALVRALARKGVRDLTVVTPGGGIDIDLLVAAGAVGKLIIGVCSLDVVGPAPSFRRAAESGAVEVTDYGVATIARSLEAAARGLAGATGRLLLGSALRDYHPGHPDDADPSLWHMPALAVDVALIHAERADRDGNLRFFAPGLDAVIAWGARRVVASVERVVPRDALAQWGTAGVPRSKVDCLVSVPFGAHPTSSYPDYATDYETLIAYAATAAQPFDVADGGWIAGDAQYRAAVTVERLLELRALAGSGGWLTWS
jgi:glutaconate CoA-transferase subunit A